jgi:hypothetical protein
MSLYVMNQYSIGMHQHSKKFRKFNYVFLNYSTLEYVWWTYNSDLAILFTTEHWTVWDHAQISQKVALSPTKGIPLTANTTPKTWVKFTNYNPMVWKLTYLFRNTNLKITFHTNNTIHNI